MLLILLLLLILPDFTAGSAPGAILDPEQLLVYHCSRVDSKVLDQPTHFRQGGPVVHRYQVHLALGRPRRQDRHRRRQEGHRRRGGR